MARGTTTLAELQDRLGQEVGVSGWITLDQARIDSFAAVTEDDQFIHTDPVRAAASPFGGTIAHGFLTLSLLSRMLEQTLPGMAGARESLNYGFDKLRFLSPVTVGTKVRGVFTVKGVENRKPGTRLLRLGVTVEMEGAERPALAAEWLVMLIYGEQE